MGAKSRHRLEFLSQHPTCCFCGGHTASQEVDHVPSRVLFKDRQWPEGFEFPACVPCNRATRLDEQVVAMLAIVRPGSDAPVDPAEVNDRIRAVRHNLPSVLAEMNPSVSQLRSAARRYGIAPAAGSTYRELPLLSVSGPLVNKAVRNFGRKLALALYFKHTGQIAPPKSGIAVRWYSNLQIDYEEIPRELASLLTGLPTLERARTNLQEQFFYRWAVSDTRTMAAFLSFYRRSFAILSFVNCSSDQPEVPDPDEVLHPYAWA